MKIPRQANIAACSFLAALSLVVSEDSLAEGSEIKGYGLQFSLAYGNGSTNTVPINTAVDPEDTFSWYGVSLGFHFNAGRTSLTIDVYQSNDLSSVSQDLQIGSGKTTKQTVNFSYEAFFLGMTQKIFHRTHLNFGFGMLEQDYDYSYSVSPVNPVQGDYVSHNAGIVGLNYEISPSILLGISHIKNFGTPNNSSSYSADREQDYDFQSTLLRLTYRF